MNFEFSDEEVSFREELQSWLKSELKNRPKDSDSDQEWAFGLEMRKKLADKGWLTMAWPEEYGGQGVSHMMQVVFAEEMSYHRAPGRDVFLSLIHI